MSDTTELWATVKDYEGLYEVSTHGRVMSFMSSAGGRLLKPISNSNGYLQVQFCRTGTIKKVLVHRAVAAAFIPNQDSKLQVNHKNGIKTDNNVDNLEWCTQAENAYHAGVTGLVVRGERHHNVTVSDKIVRQSVAEYATGKFTLEQIGKKSGVAPSTVSRWVRNKFRAV